MSTSLAKALDPMDLRFTEKVDQEKYGKRWFTYDEAALLRLPGRELLVIEEQIGMPLPSVLNGFRRNSVLGDLGVAWIAVRAHDPKLAGDFDEFTPITMAIEWRKTPGKLEDESEEEADYPDTGSSESMTSERMDTVVLQTLPIKELPTS